MVQGRSRMVQGPNAKHLNSPGLAQSVSNRLLWLWHRTRNNNNNNRTEYNNDNINNNLTRASVFAIAAVVAAVVVWTVVFVREIFDFRGGSPGAPGLVDSSSFRLGDTFFYHFLERRFSFNHDIVNPKWLLYQPTLQSLGHLFQAKMRKPESVFGLRRRVRIAY